MRLEEYFKAYARGRGIGVGEQLLKEIQSVVSVQAPTRLTRSGRRVAATPAIPFAPPRRVTGRLQRQISLVRTKNGARVVIWTPYSVPLEKSKAWYGWPHSFLSVALDNLGIVGRHSA